MLMIDPQKSDTRSFIKELVDEAEPITTTLKDTNDFAIDPAEVAILLAHARVYVLADRYWTNTLANGLFSTWPAGLLTIASYSTA